MSMYNMLFGKNPYSKVLLTMLGLKEDQCGRFRDCFLHDNKIMVYTRNGGGNREEYQEVIDELAKHKNFIRDYDDPVDCTYCYIEFSVPEEYKEDIQNIDEEDFTPTEKFKILLDRLQKGQ